jgi:hypothetical protein
MTAAINSFVEKIENPQQTLKTPKTPKSLSFSTLDRPIMQTGNAWRMCLYH